MYNYLYLKQKEDCNIIENLYIYIYIYTNLPVSTMVRLPHPWNRDSQGHRRF